MSTHPTDDLAVLALGALSSEESVPVRAHLLVCDQCSAEFAELGGTASVLAAAGPAALAPEPGHGQDVAASELVLARVQRDIRAEHSRTRRRRVAGLAGIAAAALVIGALGTAALQSVQDDTRTVVAAPTLPVADAVVLAGTDDATGASGEVTVEPAAGWVRLGLTLSGVEPGVRCRITVLTTAGERVEAGSWTTATAGEAAPRPVQAAAAVPLEEVAGVEVETLAGEPVVTLAA